VQLLLLHDDSPVFQCRHTLDLTEPVPSSTGPTTVYWDGIGACLCETCGPLIRDFFEAALARSSGERLWPVATGASGAVILGLLGRGTYVSSMGKVNGLSWRNLEAAQTALDVALLDDCTFTGATLQYLRSCCEDAGLVVQREAVLLDGRVDK
jgi:hypothetical protein